MIVHLVEGVDLSELVQRGWYGVKLEESGGSHVRCVYKVTFLSITLNGFKLTDRIVPFTWTLK